MTITVAHVLASIRPSGMERMLASSARHWPSAGTRHVVVGFGADHPFAPELEAVGYEVRILTGSPRTVRGLAELRGVLRDARVDVAHIHTEGAYLPLVFAAALGVRARRGAVVRTVHNIFSATGRWRVSRVMQALVADRFVAAIVAPSPEVAANEYRQLRRRTQVILNWVDERFFELADERRERGAPHGVPTAVMVGNCSDTKNHALALRSLLETDDALIHIGLEHAIPAGEAKLLDALERAGRITRRGAQSPDASLVEASYFLMPSLNEGMPIALAEAMVVGVPALVADSPGLRWASGMPGVGLLPLEVDAWTCALRERAWSQLSTGSSGIDFSPRRGVAEYVEVYRRALRASRSRAREYELIGTEH